MSCLENNKCSHRDQDALVRCKPHLFRHQDDVRRTVQVLAQLQRLLVEQDRVQAPALQLLKKGPVFPMREGMYA